jgi:glucan endo-1,3-alpha-glucosidase
MGDYDINTDSDDTYTSNLDGKTYMAAVSPWFFTVSITSPANPTDK